MELKKMTPNKFPLTNRLIEGFLFLYLQDWKSEEEIQKALLKKYGNNVCKPEIKTEDGTPKYQNKLRKCLAMGVKNKVYQQHSSKKSYKLL